MLATSVQHVVDTLMHRSFAEVKHHNNMTDAPLCPGANDLDHVLLLLVQNLNSMKCSCHFVKSLYRTGCLTAQLAATVLQPNHFRLDNLHQAEESSTLGPHVTT